MLAFLALLAATYLATAGAQISEYYWDITWVWASPDGFARPVIGINGQWPCPTIHVEKGGRLIVHINNKLGNETTSIHWHGLFQAGSGTMDGPSGVTQCPIPPGQTFTYDFEVSIIRLIIWLHHSKRPSNVRRLIKLEHIGITHITWANIRMDYEALWWFMINRRHTLERLTRRKC